MTKNRPAYRQFRLLSLPLAMRYGFEGMIALTSRYGSGYLRVERVAKNCGIPPEFLSKIFGRLAARGLVESQRGPGGGYSLVRDPKDIRISEIVEALAGADHGPRQCLLGHHLCSSEDKTCAIHSMASQMEGSLSAKLGGLTLGDLAALQPEKYAQ